MLSTLQIKSAKPRAKAYKLADTGGLLRHNYLRAPCTQSTSAYNRKYGSVHLLISPAERMLAANAEACEATKN